jgi:endonuclease-3
MNSAHNPRSGWTPPTRRRVYAIRDRLRLVYGIPVDRPHGDALAELILTVLSQSTNDRNRDVAYFGLRERFSSWEQVRDAPVAQIEAAIRRGGISKVKSVRIKAILEAITATAPTATAQMGTCGPATPTGTGTTPDPGPATPTGTGQRAGALDLSWLSRRTVPQAQEYLCSLPGVGRKTAACVLLFSFGMRDVPVDTHVSRVGTRLGLFRPGAPFEELHDAMLALTPRGQELELHLNLLRHGRRTCDARRPRCDACALARMCPSAFTFSVQAVSTPSLLVAPGAPAPAEAVDEMGHMRPTTSTASRPQARAY